MRNGLSSISLFWNNYRQKYYVIKDGSAAVYGFRKSKRCNSYRNQNGW